MHLAGCSYSSVFATNARICLASCVSVHTYVHVCMCVLVCLSEGICAFVCAPMYHVCCGTGNEHLLLIYIFRSLECKITWYIFIFFILYFHSCCFCCCCCCCCLPLVVWAIFCVKIFLVAHLKTAGRNSKKRTKLMLAFKEVAFDLQLLNTRALIVIRNKWILSLYLLKVVNHGNNC